MGELVGPLGVDHGRLSARQGRDHLPTFSPEGIETEQVAATGDDGIDAEPAIRP